MRIGIDARMYSSEFGIGVYISQLLEFLLHLDKKNEYVLFFNEPGFSKFVTLDPEQKNVTKILVNIPHYSLAEQISFPKILRKHHLDLMHFTNFNTPLLYRKPSIVTIHDLTIKFFPGKKYTSLVTRLAYHLCLHSIVYRSKKIIAVSEHTKKDLLKFYRLPPDKIRVIHLGVNQRFHVIADENLRSTFLKEYNLTTPYLLYTGNWRDHKNLINLIRAFAILKGKFRVPHRLVITGKEDPWYPEVKKIVAEKSLEGEIRFTGILPEEDLPLLYNNADIYVFPSLYEGFGLPALEAFACGVPVAASRASSLPEVCADSAMYFDPHDPEDIARTIHTLITDREKYRLFREKGLERIKLFSWEKTARLTLETYHAAVQ